MTTTLDHLTSASELLEGAYREAHRRAGDDVLSPWAGLAGDLARTVAWLQPLPSGPSDALPVSDVGSALRSALNELLQLRPGKRLPLDDLVTARGWVREAIVDLERIAE